MKSNIRWRQKDYATLRQEIKNFNARINYYIKHMDESFRSFLPEKVTFKEIKSNIKSRADFNRYIKNLKSLNKNTVKPIYYNGKQTTIYEKKLLQQALRSINARRARMRKEADVSTEKGTMGTIEANNLQPRKVNASTIKQDDWKEFVKNLFYQSTDKYYSDKEILYKINFIRAARNAFGPMSSVIIRYVNRISAHDLAQMLFDNPVLSIDYIYGEEDLTQRVTDILENLQEYVGNNNIHRANANRYNLEIILQDNYKYKRDDVIV